MQLDPLRSAAATALRVARTELKDVAREVDVVASGSGVVTEAIAERIVRAQDAVRGALAIAPESFTAHGRNQALEAVQALEGMRASVGAPLSSTSSITAQWSGSVGMSATGPACQGERNGTFGQSGLKRNLPSG